MRAIEIASRLEGFRGRVAGSDAERRAANWLADQLAASGREVSVETFWCRPNWALAHCWHIALAVAGSLISVASAPVGAGLVLLSLVSVVADELLGASLGRRLTPERASQNVVALPSGPALSSGHALRSGQARPSTAHCPASEHGSVPAVRLVIASNYDAGRTGFVYRDGLRHAAARLKAAFVGLTPGWLGWLTIADLWLLAIAILRVAGEHGRVVGAVQLPPTVALLIAFALLIELALSEPSPAAGDNGTGAAAAVDLVRALDIAPPRHLEVEVVLGGAGDGDQIGIRRHLKVRGRELQPRNTVVLGVAACSGGEPRWWSSDGSLFPARYTHSLRQLAAKVAAEEAYLRAAPERGRAATPAWPARVRRRPAITIGCLDRRGVVPRSHQRTDTASAIESGAIENTVQFALILIDAVDASVGGQAARRTPTPA